MADPTPDDQVYLDAAAAQAAVITEASRKWQHKPLGDEPFRAAVLSAWRSGYGQGRAKAKAAIHPVLHDLNVRIVGLAGDCHCNLIAEVMLGALTGKDETDG